MARTFTTPHNTYPSYVQQASLGPDTEMGSLHRPNAFSQQKNIYPIFHFYVSHFKNQLQTYYVWVMYSCQMFKKYTQTKRGYISPPPSQNSPSSTGYITVSLQRDTCSRPGIYQVQLGIRCLLWLRLYYYFTE